MNKIGTVKKLVDVVTFAGGGTPNRSRSEFFEGDIPWASPKDMKAWDISRTQECISNAALQQSAAKLLPSNAVLLVIRSGILKHTLPVAIARVPLAINQDMKALICGNEVLPEFLAYYLKSQEKTILGWVRATTADNLPFDLLKCLPIPIPDLAVQSEIATKLNLVHGILERRRNAGHMLDTLRSSIFLDKFGDPLVNQKGFPVVRIGDLTDVCTGTTPSRKESLNFVGSTAWVKTGEVNNSIITATEEFIADKNVASGRCKVYPRESVLIAMYGQGKTLGKSAILGIEAATNQACAVLLPNSNYKAEYVLGALQLMYEYIRTLGRGGNQPNLNLNIVRDICIPLPPIELQCRFAEIFHKIHTHKQLHQRAIEKAQELVTAIQYSAFNQDAEVPSIRDVAHV